VGSIYLVGLLEFIVRVDSKGRILIPKGLREAVGVREGGLVKVYVEGGRVVVEPLGSVADRFFGCFKVERWPDDLDGFVVEAVKEWWMRKSM